jgi:electron transfer flavoprotein beta subunit
LRLNEPRYTTLPNIMKAKKKPFETLAASTLGTPIDTTLRTLRIEPPAERSAGVKVESVAQLVDRLKTEAKVI